MPMIEPTTICRSSPSVNTRASIDTIRSSPAATSASARKTGQPSFAKTSHAATGIAARKGLPVTNSLSEHLNQIRRTFHDDACVIASGASTNPAARKRSTNLGTVSLTCSLKEMYRMP